MATIQNFHDLEVWKLARELYQRLKPIIEVLRSSKEYRFAEQLKSSAGSVMDNIAEGFERKSKLEFIYSLGVASGETGEVRSQLYRCFDDGYINSEIFNDLSGLAEKIGNQIAGFIKYLNVTNQKGLKFKNRT